MSEPLGGRESESDLSSSSSWSILDEDHHHNTQNEQVDQLEPLRKYSDELSRIENRKLFEYRQIEPCCFPDVDEQAYSASRMRLAPLPKIANNDDKLRMQLALLVAAHQYRQRQHSNAALKTALIMFIAFVSIIGIALTCFFMPRLYGVQNQSLRLSPAVKSVTYNRGLYTPPFQLGRYGSAAEKGANDAFRVYDEYKKSSNYYSSKFDKGKEFPINDYYKTRDSVVVKEKPAMESIQIGPKNKLTDDKVNFCPAMTAKDALECPVCDLFDDKSTQSQTAQKTMVGIPSNSRIATWNNKDTNIKTDDEKAKCLKTSEQNILKGVRHWGGRVKRKVQSLLPTMNTRTLRRALESNLFKINFYLVLHIVNNIILLRAIGKLKRDLQTQMDIIKEQNIHSPNTRSTHTLIEEETKNNNNKPEKTKNKRKINKIPKTDVLIKPSAPMMTKSNASIDYLDFLQELQNLRFKRIQVIKSMDRVAHNAAIRDERAGRTRDNYHICSTYATCTTDPIDSEHMIYCLSYLYARKRDFHFLMRHQNATPDVFDDKCSKFMRKVRKLEQGIIHYFRNTGNLPDPRIKSVIDLLLAQQAKRALKKLAFNIRSASAPVTAENIDDNCKKSKPMSKNLSMQNFETISYCNDEGIALCPKRRSKEERESRLNSWKERYEQLKLFWKSRQEYYEKRIEVCNIIKSIIPPKDSNSLTTENMSELAASAIRTITDQSIPPPPEDSCGMSTFSEIPTYSMSQFSEIPPPFPEVSACSPANEDMTNMNQCQASQVLDELIKNAVQQNMEQQSEPEENSTPDDGVAHVSFQLIDNVFQDIKTMFKEETAKVQQNGARLKRKLTDRLFEDRMHQLQNSVGTVKQLLTGNVSLDQKGQQQKQDRNLGSW